MFGTRLIVALLFVNLASLSSQDEQVPKVETALGSVSGYYKRSRIGRRYEAYEGIPYAEPPIGELRFEPPKPAQKWEHELSAKTQSPICVQYLISLAPHTNDSVLGSEDCLYMNIYVSVRDDNETQLPVMFWIHGGAFQFGSANELDERRLMDRRIILVTFNYRLGPFGFLSTEDDIVPGNMGLKDQSMALRWVRNNIESFGGNPRQITIFGLSSGAASVHYHYLSPLSAGLFQRGISISGVALNPRSLIKRGLEKAKKLAALVECPTDATPEMISCLKDRSPTTILEAISQFKVWLHNPATPFGPVVEKNSSTPFITRSPYEIISTGAVQDVPWVTGTVSEEGLFNSIEFVGNDTLLKELNDNWNDIAPHLLSYNDTIPLNQHEQVSEKIRRYYFESKEIDRNMVMVLIHMMRDRSYAVGAQKAVKLQAKVNKSPVWSYYYTYESRYNRDIWMAKFHRNLGVAHADDVNLVIEKDTSNLTDPEDLGMQKLLIDLYTSFAIEGKPLANVAEWRPQSSNTTDYQYLHIVNPTYLRMESNPNFAQNIFWDTIGFDGKKLAI
ncbi:carboxylic ester hydrolase-like [Xylocopa sonorina]|uniref:carboxylic ester hydrolase-like n=1 Tax=Xylocopa sonorina TaxID=1818115 RepID=UPI00403A8F80